MSKHAFLIEAHSNRKQLEMLFSCLDYEENDIFIHIDKKSKGFEDLQDNNGLKHSRLYIIPSQRVYWGGYSQVKIELELMKKAMETDDYERVHLISGVDLPLISQKEMHEYFEKHKNTEFVHYDYVNDPQIYKKRMAQYSLSSRTTSSKSVISLRPLTCHMPVMPGLIARRTLWCSS